MAGRVRDVEIYGEDVPIKIIISNYSSAFYGKSFILHFKDDNSFVLEDNESHTYRFGDEIEMPYGKFTIVSDAESVLNEADKPLTVRFNNPESLAVKYVDKLRVEQVNKNTSALVITIQDPVPNKATAILSELLNEYELGNKEDKNKMAKKTVEFLNDRLEYLTQELNSVEMNVESYKQEHQLTDVDVQAQEYLAMASATRTQVEDRSRRSELYPARS